MDTDQLADVETAPETIQELPQTSSRPTAAGPTRGVSQLPVSRVNKLIKLDPDVKLCSKEAVFLIAKLTEGAIGKLTSSAQQNARLRKRNKAVQYSDLAQAVQQRPEWFFLQDVIRPAAPLATIPAAQAEPARENSTNEAPLTDPQR
ncbi:hypothetical protein OIV83_001093 [Microbotryomycetes sp. JL201]|nr:hypothetical protein OIV83_001093 [Microbotryomycetes sp. JL201]